MTPRKVTRAADKKAEVETQAAPEQEAPPKPARRRSASTKPSAKYIRNLRGTPVHFRLQGNGEKLFRVELNRRGLSGDTAHIPAGCTQDNAFVSGVGRLFEIITKAEIDGVQYPVEGYQGGYQVSVERTSDNMQTVGQYQNDGTNRGIQQTQVQQGVGPRIADLPGSDKQMNGLGEPADLSPVSPPLPGVGGIEQSPETRGR